MYGVIYGEPDEQRSHRHELQYIACVAVNATGEVPNGMVAYTIPGVIIGGQIGPRLQGKVSQHTMVRAVGILFAVIGLAMGWIVLRAVLP